mgnify:CR=1 FL=1
MNCVACEGTGVSSRGRPCSPCAGTRQKKGARFDFELALRSVQGDGQLKCPTCCRSAHVRQEELSPERVALLIGAVRITVEDEPEGGWLEGWEEIAALAFWGLVEVEGNRVRTTDEAVSFVLGETHLPAVVSVAEPGFDDPVVAKSSRVLNVRQALGDEHDYDELMR